MHFRSLLQQLDRMGKLQGLRHLQVMGLEGARQPLSLADCQEATQRMEPIRWRASKERMCLTLLEHLAFHMMQQSHLTPQMLHR